MVAAVGDDEVLIWTEDFAEPPEELLGFELEGREPTNEEIEALDEWFESNQGESAGWTVVPVS